MMRDFRRMRFGRVWILRGVKAEQLDEVCFGWQLAGAAFRHDLKCYASGKMPATYMNGLNSTLHFMSMWHQEGGAKRFTQIFGATKARMRFVDHHLAHALSAYAFSGFDDAAVVVMDGRGAWEATSIWHGRDGRLEHVLTIPFPDSVGYFYSEFTEYLGFQRNSDEWKVMGLAPYGKPGVDLRAFIEAGGSALQSACAGSSLRTERRRLRKWCGCSGRGGFPRAKSTNGTKMLRMRCRMLARSR